MILNLMVDEKFSSQYVDFYKSEFPGENFQHVIISRHFPLRYCNDLITCENVTVVGTGIRDLLRLVKLMRQAQGIILQGLFVKQLVYLLVITGQIRKSFWCVYGGDLYSDQAEHGIYKTVKKIAVRRLKGIIVGFSGDYEHAWNKYHMKACCFYCLGPNALLVPDGKTVEVSKGDERKILLGNSADIENEHRFLIDTIKPYVNENVGVYIPLSYGDKDNAKAVEEYAGIQLGKSASPMMEFMKLDEYNRFLRGIDIAVFAHKRQQAFSNTVRVIANGSKVYMQPNSSIYKWMKEIGVTVCDINKIDSSFLSPLPVEVKESNARIIYEKCSMNAIVDQWRKVFIKVNEFN